MFYVEFLFINVARDVSVMLVKNDGMYLVYFNEIGLLKYLQNSFSTQKRGIFI